MSDLSLLIQVAFSTLWSLVHSTPRRRCYRGAPPTPNDQCVPVGPPVCACVLRCPQSVQVRVWGACTACSAHHLNGCILVGMHHALITRGFFFCCCRSRSTCMLVSCECNAASCVAWTLCVAMQQAVSHGRCVWPRYALTHSGPTQCYLTCKRPRCCRSHMSRRPHEALQPWQQP